MPWDDFLAAQGRFSPDPQAISTTSTRSISTLPALRHQRYPCLHRLEPYIFPNGTGEINPEGVAFYHELLPPATKPALSPMSRSITLARPRPSTRTAERGFLTRTTIDAFVEYAKFCFAEFTEVKHWFTFNEIPRPPRGSFIVGNWPHGEKYRLTRPSSLCNMMVAPCHGAVVAPLHEGGFEAQIGIVQNLEPKYPFDPNSAADSRGRPYGRRH